MASSMARRVVLVMVENMALNPIHIGWPGANAVMPNTDFLAHLVKQLGQA